MRRPSNRPHADHVGHRPARAEGRTRWTPSIQLISDAVMTSYIREIRTRRRNGDQPSEARNQRAHERESATVSFPQLRPLAV
jgi:hypothetical protein